MFRILVADDEKKTRRGIVTMLSRNLKADAEYLEASNGQEALEICRKEQLHLIITDICMPLLSGLDFVEQLRKTDPYMNVIIVSGYENFEYARQAVRLGVKDYIMKPLEKTEFLNLVENSLADIERKRLEKAQSYKERQHSKEAYDDAVHIALSSLVLGNETKETLSRLRKWDLIPERPFYFAVALEYEIDENEPSLSDFSAKNIAEEILHQDNYDYLCSVCLEQGILVLLFGTDYTDEFREIQTPFFKIMKILNQFCRCKCITGVGSVVFHPEELSHSSKEALTAADLKLFDLADRCIFYSDLEKDKESSGKKITFPDGKKLQEYMLERCRKAPSLTSLQEIKEAYAKMLRQTDAPKGSPRLSGLWNSFQLRQATSQILAFGEEKNVPHDTKNNIRLIRQMEAYLRLHLTEEIDLVRLADHFHLTPGYVGAIFRQGTGKSFNTYVTEHRMEMALHLLKNPSLSIQNAAEHCGYYNSKYFSVVFKKYTGISPKNYQQNPDSYRPEVKYEP